MRRVIYLIGMSVLLAGSPLWAQNAEASAAQIAKLDGLKAKVTAKPAELQKLTNNNANGVATTGANLTALFQQTFQILSKRSQEESTRPADSRDQNLIDSLNAKSDRVNTLWNLYI